MFFLEEFVGVVLHQVQVQADEDSHHQHDQLRRDRCPFQPVLLDVWPSEQEQQADQADQCDRGIRFGDVVRDMQEEIEWFLAFGGDSQHDRDLFGDNDDADR